MKKITVLLSLTLSIIFTLTSCANNWSKRVYGNGNVVKETRNVSGFDGVKASSGINVYLFQGDDEKVLVETDENLQESVITEVDGSILKCYIEGSIQRSSKLNVYVNYKKLNLIKASSGSDVYGETVIVTSDIKIDVSSGADVKVELKAETVYCNVSSGADAVLKGEAEHFDGDASSGADIKAADLLVKTCKASASSAGDIRITVSEKIEANASSGGDVVYSGNPKIEHINESSGGDVNHH